MKAVITPGNLKGTVRAIASKSMAHRLLICAALAKRPTGIYCPELSKDIEATAKCLQEIGCKFEYDKTKGEFCVEPAGSRQEEVDCGGRSNSVPGCQGELTDGTVSPSNVCPMLDVGESGSTLRFLLPVVCALGISCRIVMHGRLPERPLSPLWEELEAHGAVLRRVNMSDSAGKADRKADYIGMIEVSGRLRGGRFRIAANISSQFVSGLLFALPLLKEESCLELTGPVESESYINMTIQALEMFGVTVKRNDSSSGTGERNDSSFGTAERNDSSSDTGEQDYQPADGGEEDIARKDVTRVYVTGGTYVSPGLAEVEGDWSNGAFWEVAGMLPGNEVICTGLDENSLQGDRAIRSLKEEIIRGGAVIDCRNIPDLVPVMAVLASAAPASSITSFIHAERLRAKESDRIRSTAAMLEAFGVRARETADGLEVEGMTAEGMATDIPMSGAVIDSCNDHRIAMSAAVASCLSAQPVTILGAEAVNKSYPGFWADFAALGGRAELSEY